MVDPMGFGGQDAMAGIKVIEGELKAFSSRLAAKPRVLVINKLDLDNVTMFCVTHDPFLAKYISDSIVFLHEGVVLAEDIAERLFYDHPDPRIREFYLSVLDLK